ncbi:MAG: TonB-dependent receptor [Bacteroidales bacterium]|nr:TonB-dependent receptor [Bacteroidales bacterium]
MKGIFRYLAIALVTASAAVQGFDALAQAKLVTVTGTVTDEKGVPLAGASVVVENTTSGQITDVEGKYKIKTYSDKALVFSFIGYKPKTFLARSSRTLNVALDPDTKLLDEVVVVGYGTMKRSDLTGSVSSVNAKALENFKTSSVTNILGGMIAGVNVTSTDGTPGAGYDIKIRGVGTVTGDASPLYIVDGFEVSDISYLATQDIKSIEVLKDASASAIYGARAANGVVLVTTKSGRIGRPEITYNGSASYRILSKRLDVLTPYEFVDLQMEVNPTKYAGMYYKEGNDSSGNPYRFQTMDDYKDVKGVVWQDEAFRPTWSQSHDVSVSGGSRETQYLVSFSHFDEDGIFASNSFAKNTARLKLNQQLFKWMSLSVSVDYTNTKNTGVGTGGSTLSNILMYRPVGGLRTTDYQLRHNPIDPIIDELNVTSSNSFYNPLVNAENTDKDVTSDRWNAYGSLMVRLGKFLNFRTSGNFSLQGTRTNQFFGNGTSSADRGSGPYGNSKIQKYMRWGVTNQLTYSQTFKKKHRVNAILGHETSFNRNESFYGEAKNFSMDELGTDNLGLGAVPSSVTSSRVESRRLSFFARAFYSYDDRYMLTATVRADASSVFSSKHKWGCFPSFAAAWTMNKEEWLRDVSWLSNLKLRAGWGMVGNDRITNYLSLDLYNSSKYGVGESQTVILTPAHLANDNLKWEAAMTTNVGIDAGFFNDRLNVTLDAFLKDSKDLLLAQDLSYVAGFETQMQNIGQLRNKGLELSISSINFEKRNFSWRTDFNISFIRNTLVSLQSGKTYKLDKSGISSSFSAFDYISEVGKPLGSMYGYVFDGVYQVSDFEYHADGTRHLRAGVADISQHAGKAVFPGHVKYKDLDGDGIITDADRTAIGNGQPDFYGGMTNSFYIYGIDLSFVLQFTYGNEIYNAQRLYANQTDLEMFNMMGEVRDRWRQDHASNKVPAANGIIRHDITSRFIEDGSFLRLKNITLGYTFPQKWLRKLYVSKLRVYASADNLLLLTKYSGFDPEVNMRSSALMPSFDYGAYPKSKVFTFGVELNF